MNVLGIGEVVWDKVAKLESYPKEGSKVKSVSNTASIGGPVPIGLITLAHLGIDCALVAAIGKDTYASKIKAGLEKEGIDFVAKPTRHTKVNTVLVNEENGSRTIIKEDTPDNLIKSLNDRLIKSADIILLDRHESILFDQIMTAKKPSAKVIIDTSTETSENALRMLAASDYPIIPIEILEKVSPRSRTIKSALEKMYSLMNKTVVVTAGPYGSVIYDGKNIETVPALQVRTVDTLGAGDVFRGAFAYGVLQEWDIKKTVAFANRVAGLQCTRLGNATAIPEHKEILRSEFRYNFKDVSLNDIILALA